MFISAAPFRVDLPRILEARHESCQSSSTSVARVDEFSKLLLQQVSQSGYRRCIGFEKTVDDFFQLFAGHGIELKVSFFGFGDKFRIFQGRLEGLPENLHPVFGRSGWKRI